MADFNLHRWFKNQYLQENDDPKIGDELEAGLDGTGVAENEETQDTASLAAKAINNAIMAVDDTMHYGDFAKAVATILKDEYGTHNFGKFMNVLHAELGMNESLNEEEDIPAFLEKLAQDLKIKYPELRFFPKFDKINVEGSNQDKADFANATQKTDWGNGFTTFDVDDDDMGYIVRITRVNRFK